MSRRTLLLVEDQLSVRSALELEFQDLGWRVLTARDAREADDIMSEAPHLAIVDLMLPPTGDREGLLVARRLRELFPALPIVVFTNRSEVTLLAEARAVADLVFEKSEDLGHVVDSAIALVRGHS